MTGAAKIDSARAYLQKYDVVRPTPGGPDRYRGRMAMEVGPSGKIERWEMNREEPARVLQGLSDQEFEKVWAVMTDAAKRLYFFRAYPELKKFKVRTAEIQQMAYFDRVQLESDEQVSSLLRCITNERDLEYFVEIPSWISSDLRGDDFGIESIFGKKPNRKTNERLKQAAQRMISGGAVSPNGPSLLPPK